MHRQPKTVSTSCNILHRLLELCWSKHAYISVLRLVVRPNPAHIFLLHCISPHIQLAAHNHNVSVPPVPRQEAKRPPEPYRFLRLRPRPASPRHDSFHTVVLLTPYRHCILLDFCIGADGHHLAQSGVGHSIGLFESLSSFRPHVTHQGLTAFTR